MLSLPNIHRLWKVEHGYLGGQRSNWDLSREMNHNNSHSVQNQSKLDYKYNSLTIKIIDYACLWFRFQDFLKGMQKK